MPPALLPRRWALTPPFHPCLQSHHEDIPKVFLRAITGLHIAGGIFSVALSVAEPHCIGRSPIPHAKHRVKFRFAAKPAWPAPWRYQARCPLRLRGFGVRTFLPPNSLPRPGQRSSSSPATAIISRIAPKGIALSAAYAQAKFPQTAGSGSIGASIPSFGSASLIGQ